MLKKYIIVAITAVFTMVACTEKFDEPGILPAGSDNVHTLSVGIEAGTYTPAEGATKASMEAVIRVNWMEGDEVSVVNATKGKILGGCLEAKESGTSVVFEGTVKGTINQGDKLYYIYPKLNNTEEIAFDNAGYNQSLANQTYNGNDPGKVCFYGYAEDVAGTSTISKKIQFNLVTAYAHLNMSNLPAKGAPLSSIDISNVNEGFTWKLSSGTLTAAPYAGSNSISVDCTNCNITQAGNAVARFAIPASAASDEARVVKVNKAYRNEKYIKTELLSSAYYNQLYTSWESNVSITPKTDKTEVSITNEGSTEVAEGVIPVEQAFDVTKPTEIGIGGVGTITFNETATSNIKSNASGSTEVFFKIEDVTETQQVQNANLVYEVTMKTVDQNGTEVFSESNAGEGSRATITIELGQSVQSVQSVSLVDENGDPVSGNAVENRNFDPETGRLTFDVLHFSRYAIKYTTKETPESDYVAQIGNRKYTTLANAIAAAQNGNTITMIGNDYYEVNNPITIGANLNVILDLNGKTVSAVAPSEYGSALITNNGTLTIKDSGSEGKLLMLAQSPDGREISGYACNTVTNNGRLVVNGGIIQNETTGAAACYPIDNVTNDQLYSPTVEINGGRFIAKSNTALRLFCNSTTNMNTAIINGGYFEAVYYAISIQSSNDYANKGTVVIKDGEFEATADERNCSVACRSGNSDAISLTINGGKFNDYIASEAGTNKISGGLFKYDSYFEPESSIQYKLSDYVAFGYHIEANSDTQTSSAYPWRVVANSAEGAEVSISKPGQTTVYSTLAAFRDATNAGNTFAGYTVKLLKDIDMTGVNNWKAIGDDGNEYDNCDKNFSGIFDGNGKTISNLTISSPEYWGAALFGYVDGTIKNLTISNSSCSGCGGNAILAVMCGGNVTIENCHLVGCNVSTSSSSGLMISYVLSAENAVIKNCSTDEQSSITSTGGYQIGGIIGQTTSINTLQVIDCVNRASVTGVYGIGGIIGQFGNNITNATLTRCKNYGAIQLTNYTIQYAGGIAGVIPTTTLSYTNYSFVECENHGTVLAASEWPTFNSCTGGMIGYAYQNAYVTLSMTGCKNTAVVGSDRSIYSGGMIGWHHYAAGTGVFQYTECTNTGAITATQNAQQGNHNAGRAGQLVGCSDNSHDNSTNCVLTGTASANGVTKLSGEEVN